MLHQRRARGLAGVAVTMGIAWLGERFTWTGLAGMVLILVGVVAVTLPPRARNARKSAG